MALLNEFMTSFLDKNTNNLTNYIKTKLDTIYKPADTMLQYLEYFNNQRKQVGPNMAAPANVGPQLQGLNMI